MFFVLAALSKRWRQSILNPDVPLNDALPTVIAAALIFGVLAVGSVHSLWS